MTQCDKILAALQQGETITPYRALQIAGSLRLSERIRELVRQGIPIDKEWVKTENTRLPGYKLGGIAHG